MIGILRALGWFYAVQPVRWRLAWGAALGFFLRLTGARARIVRRNLEIAYPGPEREAERDRLYRQAYAHVGHLFFEILLVFGAMRKFCERSVELVGLENWRKANERGRGAIYLSSHVGNWEVMAAKGAMAGMDLMIVTKHLKPEWLHQAIERGRAACGVSGTYEPRTLRDALAHFKKKGTVGFILDQYAGPPIGVRVPVFGLPVGTASAIAMLAKRTGAPVLPVVNYRKADGTMVVDIRPELNWIEDENSNREIAINTAHYAAVLEADIRSHPEQWLWIHNRFKGDLSPLGPEEWERSRARTRIEV